MNKKILLGSIIAVVILILVALNPVVAISKQNPTKIQQSSNKSEKTTGIINNNMESYVIYINRVYVLGIVKNVRWWWNSFHEKYLLLLDVVDVILRGTFYTTIDGDYFATYRLNESKDWEMWFRKYLGFDMLKMASSPQNVNFIFGRVKGGSIYYD